MTDETAAVVELYGLPLDEFTAARNDLAARLKDEGDAEAANRVRALKKPSLSAWIVNQLVRERELDVRRLLETGEAVGNAQRDLLAGKKPDIEAVRREERAAIRILREAAREINPSVSAAVLDRVGRTLEAASSAEGREVLGRGLLTEDLAPPGFESLTGFPVSQTPPSDSKQDRLRQGLIDRRDVAKKKAREASAEAQQAEKEARAAAVSAERARTAAESARRRASSMVAELEAIEAELAKVQT